MLTSRAPSTLEGVYGAWEHQFSLIPPCFHSRKKTGGFLIKNKWANKTPQLKLAERVIRVNWGKWILLTGLISFLSWKKINVEPSISFCCFPANPKSKIKQKLTWPDLGCQGKSSLTWVREHCAPVGCRSTGKGQGRISGEIFPSLGTLGGRPISPGSLPFIQTVIQALSPQRVPSASPLALSSMSRDWFPLGYWSI